MIQYTYKITLNLTSDTFYEINSRNKKMFNQ